MSSHPLMTAAALLTLESTIEHFPFGLDTEEHQTETPFPESRFQYHQQQLKPLKPFPFEGILLALLTIGSAPKGTETKTRTRGGRVHPVRWLRLGNDVALTVAIARSLHRPNCVAENASVCIRPRFAHCVARPVSWCYREALSPEEAKANLHEVLRLNSEVTVKSTSFFLVPGPTGERRIKWQTLDREYSKEEDVQQAVALATLPPATALLKNPIPKFEYEWRQQLRTRRAYLLRLAEVARLAEEKDLFFILEGLARMSSDDEEAEEPSLPPTRSIPVRYYHVRSSEVWKSQCSCFLHSSVWLEHFFGLTDPWLAFGSRQQSPTLHGQIRTPREILKLSKKPLLCERTTRDEEPGREGTTFRISRFSSNPKCGLFFFFRRRSPTPRTCRPPRQKPKPPPLHRASNQQAKQCIAALSCVQIKTGKQCRKVGRGKEPSGLRTH
jgi:hypothetical protein